MTVLKVDNLICEVAGTDLTVVLPSGLPSSGDYASATGFVDPTTNSISTTGVISGAAYKTSGNVTVINSAGAISPYGLYLLPTGYGTVPVGYGISGYCLSKVSGNQTSWEPISTIKTVAFSAALGKC
jgi:hypothetical protein